MSYSGSDSNEDYYVYKAGDDLLKSLNNGNGSNNHNDVKLVCDDGEIEASKAILAARSEYFAKMFDNTHQFHETSGIAIVKCRKKVMLKVIEFLYAGKIDRRNMNLYDFMEIMDLLRMMLLKDGSDLAYDKCMESLQSNRFPLRDCLSGIKISLDQDLLIEKDLIRHIQYNLRGVVDPETRCSQAVSQMTAREFDLIMFYSAEGPQYADELLR